MTKLEERLERIKAILDNKKAESIDLINLKFKPARVHANRTVRIIVNRDIAIIQAPRIVLDGKTIIIEE